MEGKGERLLYYVIFLLIIVAYLTLVNYPLISLHRASE